MEEEEMKTGRGRKRQIIIIIIIFHAAAQKKMMIMIVERRERRRKKKRLSLNSIRRQTFLKLLDHLSLLLHIHESCLTQKRQ